MGGWAGERWGPNSTCISAGSRATSWGTPARSMAVARAHQSQPRLGRSAQVCSQSRVLLQGSVLTIHPVHQASPPGIPQPHRGEDGEAHGKRA